MRLTAVVQGYHFDRYYRHTADLHGCVAVVTGCTVGGLGFAAAQMLLEMGAKVVITTRSEEKAKAAVQALRRRAGRDDSGTVSYVLVNFLSESSVHAAAAEIRAAYDRLDLLILNAGIGGGDSAAVWMTNHVGPFLFTSELMPLLQCPAETVGNVRVIVS